MNEFRQKCIDELSEALDHPLLFDRSAADRREIARTVATKLFMQGWTPPAEPEVKEEWRSIPGFSAWEASNKGFIRHALSHVWVPISAIGEQIQPVTLYDDNGRDVELAYEQIIDTTFPKEGTDILFDNGSVAHIPDAEFTGVTTAVEIREEEWRDIDCIPGLESFEIEHNGTIRNKRTKRIREAEYDIDYNAYVVRFIINGRPIHIVPERLVGVMWDDQE